MYPIAAHPLHYHVATVIICDETVDLSSIISFNSTLKLLNFVHYQMFFKVYEINLQRIGNFKYSKIHAYIFYSRILILASKTFNIWKLLFTTKCLLYINYRNFHEFGQIETHFDIIETIYQIRNSIIYFLTNYCLIFLAFTTLPTLFLALLHNIKEELAYQLFQRYHLELRILPWFVEFHCDLDEWLLHRQIRTHVELLLPTRHHAPKNLAWITYWITCQTPTIAFKIRMSKITNGSTKAVVESSDSSSNQAKTFNCYFIEIKSYKGYNRGE